MAEQGPPYLVVFLGQLFVGLSLHQHVSVEELSVLPQERQAVVHVCHVLSELWCVERTISNIPYHS